MYLTCLYILFQAHSGYFLNIKKICWSVYEWQYIVYWFVGQLPQLTQLVPLEKFQHDPREPKCWSLMYKMATRHKSDSNEIE